MLASINIQDPGLQLALNGKLQRTSPGFAVLDGERLLVGEAAFAAARRLPRWTNSRFWAELNTKPLPGGSAQVRHHADLAFAHLEELWQPVRKRAKEVIFCVPSHYDGESLGLLLGMAKECGMPVKGVADQSILAAAGLSRAPRLLHLDLQLHSVTLTSLANAGALARQTVQTIAETGLVTLWERWANSIAKQFIQANRFDPLDDAAVEQQLFDRLPGWVAALDGAGAPKPFELKTGAGVQRIQLAPEALIPAVSPLYQQLAQAIRDEAAGERLPLLVSHTFKGFPGLMAALAEAGDLDVIQLPADKPVASAAVYRDAIVSKDGPVTHVVQLASAGGKAQGKAKAAAPVAAEERPTHLLAGHRALPIGAAFKLPRDLAAGLGANEAPLCSFYPRGGELLVEPHSDGVQVNRKAISDATPLALGDSVTAGEHQLTLIRVAANG